MRNENTEEKIFNAAKKVFIVKGSSGARMQEIADEAGINKSLLHYYYRNKEKLFASVFKFTIAQFIPDILKTFTTDDDFFTKIETFIHGYFDMMRKNPFIPMFILNELQKGNTGQTIAVLTNTGVNIKEIEQIIENEIQKGNIKQVDAKNLIINILSLIIFPFVSRPLAEVLIFNKNKKAFEEFLDQRKEIVTNLIINSLKK